MAQAVIENPIINSPFEEPNKHFKFSEEGITSEIEPSRRVSSYFVPIPAAKKQGKQQQFETEWTADRLKENEFINQIRFHVGRWRINKHAGATKVTKALLDYWTDSERERKLFFCQVEALETAIYLTEVAHKDNATWIVNQLHDEQTRHNPDLFRIALKMATGSGKTVVMGMLIAWQALNKLANPQDSRFSDAFLIVTPGITIRDRLRVLLPNDPNNYYRERDLVPPEMAGDLNRAKIVITNFHAFKLREKSLSKLNKAILKAEETGAFKESPEQMVRRVCAEFHNKRNIVVLNDEAHHCYRHKIEDPEEIALKGDERKEAETREEDARIWISGLEAVKRKLGVKVVYDLSATPFFLRGSGYSEGTMFPWVVSDFSLIDAIECGIVKVPRVPVSDDSMTGDAPTYRELWSRIRDELPKKGRKTDAVGGEPKLPKELQGALHSLYGHYEKQFAQWESNAEARANGATPPVFIVVCNNTNVSKLVFDYIAGWNKNLTDGSQVPVKGELELFSNVIDGRWSDRPNTILVDSLQLESGEGMSDEFKKLAATQIEEFKEEYRQRFPGRDLGQIDDDDLLREVMNTVGKPGKLGEDVRCVVSVSMLTEGWDANTVTHILGVRAFSTQLLCEQVVGRGLRRMNYTPNDAGFFEPEYAEVYGVPFSFIPAAGAAADPKPGPIPTRIRALEERVDKEITFPRLMGYRYEMPPDSLEVEDFSDKHKMALSTQDVPSKTEMAAIVGEGGVHDLADLKRHREQEVAFLLAKLTLEQYFKDIAPEFTIGNGEKSSQPREKPWLFPQVLEITKQWLEECVVLKDNTFKQMLLLHQFAYDAADKIHNAIAHGKLGHKPRLMPILFPYEFIGSTRWVEFHTTKPTWKTDPEKCHISHVAGDSGWELKMAEALEGMDEVMSYVKNQGLSFYIPYVINGDERRYLPDFIVRYDDGMRDPIGNIDPLNLIVEVSGQKKREKGIKVSTAEDLWVPAVNNSGAFGRWAFIESSDPWDAVNTIRAFVEDLKTRGDWDLNEVDEAIEVES